MHYFSTFFKKANKPCVKFLRVWTKNPNCWEILKTCDEISIEKLNFYFLKFVTKNSSFGNSNIFLHFSVSGGGFPTFPLAYMRLAARPKGTKCLEGRRMFDRRAGYCGSGGGATRRQNYFSSKIE